MAPTVDTTELEQSFFRARAARHHEPFPEEDCPPLRLNTRTLLATTAVCVVYFAQLIAIMGATAQAREIAKAFEALDYAVCFPVSLTILPVLLGPIFSQAAESVGRKWFLVAPTVMGGVGSVIVATAPSFTVAILGHCVMGCGLANQPLLFTIIAEILPRRWRSFGHASLMVTSCLGSTVGLLVVGGIPPQDHFGAWRTYYFVNLGCHAVGVLFAVLAYRSPSPDMPEVVQRRELTRMDWPGYTILFFALSAFSASFFISHAPTSAEQDSAIPGFLVGLLMVIALLIYELVGRKDGFLNHNLFLHRNFALATLSLFGAGVSFAAFEWCFLTQTVNLYDADPFLSGVRSIVTLVSAMIAAPLAAWYCCAKRKIRGASVVGFAACLAFYIAMAHTDQTTNIQTWIYPTFLGAAMGILMVTLPTSAQLSIPSQLLSMGTALLICGFILGRSIGFIIYDHLVQSAMVEGYPAIVHRLLYSGSPKEFADEVITYLKSNQAGPLPDVPGLTDAILDDGMAALKACYVAAFKKAWIAAGCFAGVSMLTASPMDNPEEQFTMKIDVPLESTAEVEPKP